MPLMEIKIDLIDGGGLIDQINEALGKLCTDVVQRPHLKKPRKLTLEISIEPKLEEKMNPATQRFENYPELDWSLKNTLPGASGMKTRAFVHDGKVCVNPGAWGETNPNQLTLDDVQPEAREGSKIVRMG